MAKEGSVAPKERVNVVYKPATGDAQEEVELPLKLLVMSDFTLRENDTPIEDRKAINVDKDNFNDVMKAQNVNLNVYVDNKLGDGDPDDKMNVNLDFNSMADFEPDAIIKKVPELNKILELREALKAVKGPLGNIPDFKKKLSSIVKDEGSKERLLKELGIEK